MESSIYCPNDLFFCEQHFFKHRQPACRYKKLQAQGCRLQAQQNCNLPYFLRNYLVYQVIYLCSCLQVFIYVYVYNTSLVLHFLFFFLAYLEIPFTLDGYSEVKSRMEGMVDCLTKHLLHGQNSSLVPCFFFQSTETTSQLCMTYYMFVSLGHP